MAMILIILGHLSWSWTRFFTPFDGIGVALFLIVSGYGLNVSYQRNGLAGFWRKRFLRVYVPWFITANILALWKGIAIVITAYFIAFIFNKINNGIMNRLR